MIDSPRKSRSVFRSFGPADLVTVANASCGMGAILFCLNRLAGEKTRGLWMVFFFLILAAVFDILDGLIARQGKKSPVPG